MRDSTMHIVLSADDNYAKYMAVTMVSILCNKHEQDELCFHVLDGGIAPENRKRIIEAVQERGAEIRFLSVDDSLFSGKVLNITEKNHVTLPTYYRLLIPSLIQSDRCIYMDCDMICRSSLAELWHTEMNGCLAAAVKDIDEEKHTARLRLERYFNSGLLLMDLKAMREESVQERFFRFMEEKFDCLVMHDQDVLNGVLHGRIHELAMTWNCQVTKTRKCRETGFYDLSRTARILHFIGHRKPWMRGCKAPEKKEYWKYRAELPWNSAVLIEKLWTFVKGR